MIVHVLTAPNISTRAPRKNASIRAPLVHKLTVYDIRGRFWRVPQTTILESYEAYAAGAGISAIHLLQALNAPHLRRNQRRCGL